MDERRFVVAQFIARFDRISVAKVQPRNELRYYERNMHAENSILIRADRRVIFDTVSNLDNWPKLLPHYRWIRTLKEEGSTRIVNMAARRGRIPIQWTSRYWIDAERCELHFQHLKAFTKGMMVVWTLTPTPDGVLVRIAHDLEPRWPLIGKFVVEEIIGRFFIHPVASRTLAEFKRYHEAENPNPEIRSTKQIPIQQ